MTLAALAISLECPRLSARLVSELVSTAGLAQQTTTDPGSGDAATGVVCAHPTIGQHTEPALRAERCLVLTLADQSAEAGNGADHVPLLSSVPRTLHIGEATGERVWKLFTGFTQIPRDPPRLLWIFPRGLSLSGSMTRR